MAVEDPRAGILAQVGAAWVARHEDQVSAELLRRVVEELVATKLPKLHIDPSSEALKEFLDHGHPLEWVQELGRELTAAIPPPFERTRDQQRGHGTGQRRG